MKTYNNGPRKSMMYEGMSRRKPMMYGGKAIKPRKKAQMGGMMSATQQQQNMMQNNLTSRQVNQMQTDMMQNNMTSGQMNQMQTQMMQTPKLRMSRGGEANLQVDKVKRSKERAKKRKEASDAYRKKRNELGRIMGPDSLSPGEQKLMGRSTNNVKFGMLSVKAGIDNNPRPTKADRIAGAKMKR